MQCLPFLYPSPLFFACPLCMRSKRDRSIIGHNIRDKKSTHHVSACLEAIDGTESLDFLERLKGLKGLKYLERLEGLEGLQGLQRLLRLGSFICIERLEVLRSLDCLEGLEGLELPESCEHWSWAFGLSVFRLLKNQKHKNRNGKRRTFFLWLTVRIAI